MEWDIEVCRSTETGWEYAATVSTEEKATKFVTTAQVHLSDSAPAVCFRISPVDAGGPDEFLYWKDGKWTDPAYVL